MPTTPGRILLTGASGYLGGRLLQVLEKSGAHVRCLARRPDLLVSRVAAETEVVYGDLLKPESLAKALGRDFHFGHRDAVTVAELARRCNG
ncbi:MAG: NAD(P)H-binding protein, partial [Acidobacteria bacterium]|nr:NAD(P)H-binding protein [Acidobacteriota bacterium]MDA1237108.1 NAD(P)H-binding protein [Acidobacteriota bacterium]